MSGDHTTILQPGGQSKTSSRKNKKVEMVTFMSYVFFTTQKKLSFRMELGGDKISCYQCLPLQLGRLKGENVTFHFIPFF